MYIHPGTHALPYGRVQISKHARFQTASVQNTPAHSPDSSSTVGCLEIPSNWPILTAWLGLGRSRKIEQSSFGLVL